MEALLDLSYQLTLEIRPLHLDYVISLVPIRHQGAGQRNLIARELQNGANVQLFIFDQLSTRRRRRHCSMLSPRQPRTSPPRHYLLGIATRRHAVPLRLAVAHGASAQGRVQGHDVGPSQVADHRPDRSDH